MMYFFVGHVFLSDLLDYSTAIDADFPSAVNGIRGRLIIDPPSLIALSEAPPV